MGFATIEEYIEAAAPDRQEGLRQIRQMFRDHVPDGIVEEMSYNMPGYTVSWDIYPKGYHCNPKLPLPFAGFSANKGGFSLYLFCVYPDSELSEWLQSEFATAGLKLDMGKSCIRFKKIEEKPLEIIGRLLDQLDLAKFIAIYEEALVR